MSRSLLLPCLLLSTTAMAHTGGEAHGFIAGALHPMAGLDHLLAMLVVILLVTVLLHVVGVLLTTQTLRPLPRGALLKWSGSAVAAFGVVSLGVLLSSS